MNKTNIKKLTLSAMFVAIGLVLPIFTGQIPQIGSMLLPMHIPVLLCGFICGWQCGLAVGFVLPLMRSLIFGMPVLFPMALAMAFELAAYGFLSGLLYSRSRWHCLIALYRCLIISMVGGRIVFGVVMAVFMGLSGSVYTIEAFAAGAFVNAVPGILLQLIFIPAVMVTLNKTGLVKFGKNKRYAEGKS